MPSSSAKKNPKVLIIVGLAILFGLYQLAAPYLEETAKLEEENKKLAEQIEAIQKDAQFFSNEWETDIILKEKELEVTFPEKITTQSIIRYFGTDFEKTHEGVTFTNLLPQTPSVANIKVDTENPNIKPRIIKAQIKATLPPKFLLEYLDHIEKYPGLWDLSDFTALSIAEGTKSIISMDVLLDLYLQPKDWIKKEEPKTTEPKEKTEKREVAQVSTTNQTMTWFETDDLKEKPVEEEKPEIEIKKKPRKPSKLPPPKIAIKQFMGTGIVVNDDFYEEGDSIDGWRVLKIVKSENFIVIKKSTTAYKVVIK